jgi:hypothetical protein
MAHYGSPHLKNKEEKDFIGVTNDPFNSVIKVGVARSSAILNRMESMGSFVAMVNFEVDLSE